ncbi:response regulator [Paenibacillus sp. LHD-117]|uniref:response regulator transcription factor n=1 Tax=Paenibacillus sp. LHD-117 TaxID=3071412 RepID=UPI0027E11B45|nr:helix-turn-helix domain-containing protein [Paenibacillus sp. LHD-117]MDQ6421207.1 response regulator [Paenibacillus sp. LHD-117]
MKVIIADDEEMIRRGLAKILGNMGLDVEIVGSYSNGLDAWTHISGLADGELDVLITDIKMPMMDGLKLAEKLKDRPIVKIVLSGFSEFDYARKALRFGVMDYLLKPVDKGALQELLLRIRQEKAEEAKPADPADKGNSAAQQVRAVLESEYAKSPDMEALAEQVGMSANYLSRLFKQETGETITDYLIAVRIAKAKQFLTDHPHLKNYEIAQLVGYADPVYFNKLFKKVVGVTPKEYRTQGG